MIRVTLRPARCHLLHRRVHHALPGFALAAAGAIARQPLILAAGLALVASDLQDRRAWLPDLLAHA